jgi:GTP pyrophosphokinase
VPGSTRLHTHPDASLDEKNFDLHLVSARAKEPLSLLQKIRRKEYDDPATEFTDRLGVRVITYYAEDVDPVVETLKNALRIDDPWSDDKRVALALREFGYRSVHLLAQIPLDGLEDEPTRLLGTE